MPRLIYQQTNFTAGEISPRVLGRVDIDRYANAVETSENALSVIHGGITNRYGSLYVAKSKTGTKKCRLIPFIFSTTQAYVLEFGEGYIRFYTSGAQILSAPLTPYEIASPYTEAQLFELDYVQAKDTMFVFHKDQPVYRIRRFADASWDAGPAPFAVIPFDEVGDQFATTLTLSAATVGAGRVATASGATFLVSDIGRTITYQGGTLLITAYTDSTHVTGTISTPFPATAIPVGWTLTGSPLTSATPSAKDPVGGAVTLTAASNAWRTTDVGKFVSINGGTVVITGYTDALNVTGIIRQVLTGTTAAPADSWTLKAAVWSTGQGYPRCGTFYQQRLCVAGSNTFPDRLWGSSIGLYLDFTIGTNDDDAFAFDLTSDQSNPAVHLVSGSDMLAMTYGGEFSIKGGIEKAITPTNIQVSPETTYGISSVKPFRVGKELLYVDQFATQILAMKFFAADDAYDSSDITALAEHITGPGLQDMSYARRPDPILYGVRTDGVIAACTFSREQNVVAWSRWRRNNSDLYESVATIPTTTGSQTWAVVHVVQGGVHSRYIERLDSNTLLDSAITGTSGPGATVWAGLDHLNGRIVACIADGVDASEAGFLVTGGQITIPRAAFNVVIGSSFASTIKLLTPEVQTGEGSAQGQNMSTNEIIVDVLNTQSLIVNGHVVPFRNFGPALLDRPPTVYTGQQKIPNVAWQNGKSDITITNTRPFRFHIRSIIRTLTVNS